MWSNQLSPDVTIPTEIMKICVNKGPTTLVVRAKYMSVSRAQLLIIWKYASTSSQPPQQH